MSHGGKEGERGREGEKAGAGGGGEMKSVSVGLLFISARANFEAALGLHPRALETTLLHLICTFNSNASEQVKRIIRITAQQHENESLLPNHETRSSCVV